MEAHSRSERRLLRALGAAWLGLLVGLLVLLAVLPRGGPVTVPYSRFLTDVERGTIRAVTLDDGWVRWTLPGDAEHMSRLPADGRTALRVLRAERVAVTVLPRHHPIEPSWFPVLLAAGAALYLWYQR